jgi:predicted anti-sigma-YlaC factor YlaD
MTCRETIRLICEYLEGVLVPSVKRDVEEHFKHCSSCRMVLDAAQKTLADEFNVEIAHAA